VKQQQLMQCVSASISCKTQMDISRLRLLGSNAAHLFHLHRSGMQRFLTWVEISIISRYCAAPHTPGQANHCGWAIHV
jgi:hypothetical protein